MAQPRLLLDTHAALWWWRDIPRLGAAARSAIEAGGEIAVSVVSAFEISLKWRLGKLSMIEDPGVNYPLLMVQNGFVDLPVTQAHTLAAGLFADEHRDPFDRIIAAQVLQQDMTIITRDPAFTAFGCKVLW